MKKILNISDKMKKLTFWKMVKSILYFIVIVVSILIIASTLKIGGWSMYAVTSGSMEPKIHTGSIVFDQKQSDYRVNEIITYTLSGKDKTVTHRINEVNDINGTISYQVKGDANNAPDSESIYMYQVVGRVLFSLPLLGYIVAFARTLPGLVILVIIPATIIIYEEIGKIRSEMKRIKKKGTKDSKITDIRPWVSLKNKFYKIVNGIKTNYRESRKRESEND